MHKKSKNMHLKYLLLIITNKSQKSLWKSDLVGWMVKSDRDFLWTRSVRRLALLACWLTLNCFSKLIFISQTLQTKTNPSVNDISDPNSDT